MKNRILFSLIVAVIPFFGFAQIDDMYFVPQKETKVNEDKHPQPQPSVRTISENTAVDTRSGYAQGSIRDVDEYNRRYRWDNDSISAAEEEVAG